MTQDSVTTSWRAALTVYLEPRVLAMLFLGFAAGLPFPLVFTTLSAWLRDVGVERATIGFFAWIGITYSIKVFWAPVVDRLPLPWLTRTFGQRRSWMLLAQGGIALGLIGMAYTDPTQDIVGMAWWALLVAFASATQDIAIDAYRIEAIEARFQGAMAGTYQSGYRVAAALVGGAGALYLAQYISWSTSYLVMALSMGVGIITVLLVREPVKTIDRAALAQERRVVDFLASSAQMPAVLRVPTAWFIGAVICPFSEFFQRNGWLALWILALIGLYRISDIVMGNMANPFYIDLGFTKSEIANVAKLYGVTMTIAGALAGGALVVRFGMMRMLLLGAVLVAATNLLFAALALGGKSLPGLVLVISADNFSSGLAGSALIAYLSRLTSTAYTATQYALFSSLMTLIPKVLSGFSGVVVDGYGYASFFIYTAAVGVPTILLVIWFMLHTDMTSDGNHRKRCDKG